MDSYADRQTDKSLAELEARIRRIYAEAGKEMQQKASEYFYAFIARDKAQQELVAAGKLTEGQYKQWRLAQIGRGKRYEALRDQLAERANQANRAAAEAINKTMPGVYALNRNYAAYTIEQVGGNIGFTLWNEAAVNRLITEQPGLMPHYPPMRAVKRGIDLAYGRQQITAQVTSSLLVGESIGKVADHLQQRIAGMNRASAVRAARTSVTAAQNGGRMDSYAEAEQLGIKVRKRWIATKDERTRASHAELDGEIVPLDKPFSNGLMYPGDPSGPPAETYNCRCTVAAVEKDGIEAEPRMMRVRDPATGRNKVVPQQSYEEWITAKGKSAGSNDSIKRGTAEQISSVDFSEKSKVLQQLEIAERSTQGTGYEINYSVTSDGKVWRVIGDAGTVDPSVIPSSLMGSYSYHNHPADKTWYSFSAADAAFFIESGEAFSKASDDIFEYVMRRTPETLAKSYDDVYHRFKEITDTEVRQMEWDGIIDPDRDEYHEAMKILSGELRFDYERKAKDK